jgi:hypothetical protein
MRRKQGRAEKKVQYNVRDNEHEYIGTKMEAGFTNKVEHKHW